MPNNTVLPPTGLTRRRLIQGLAAISVSASVSACSQRASIVPTAPSDGQVVVIGGGFGGATTAKYIKRANPQIAVTLIEPKQRFHTCPFSNLVLAGERRMEQISHGYAELQKGYGVRVIQGLAHDVDPIKRQVTLLNGSTLGYDRLVLSPGIDIDWNALTGYDQAAADLAPHAWVAGEQTRLLRQQLAAMDDGGVFIITAPANPFRCPPGPYERASLVAHYLNQHKPRSKVLILDAKENFSKQALFQQSWQAVYGNRIEWVGLSGDGKVTQVDAAKRTVETEFGTRHRASVLNVVPPQKAGIIAQRAGVTDRSGWAPVDPRTFESTLAEHVYVIGDASVAAPMPKSGFAANAQGKVAAAAIVASLAGREPPEPYWANTCYSLINPDYGISVAGVYRLEQGKITSLPDSGGVSPLTADIGLRQQEAAYAYAWYNAITQDTWGTA